MLNRLKAALAAAVGRSEPAPNRDAIPPGNVDDLAQVEFRSLDPGSVTGANVEPLQCPVTRRELRRADKLFQCRVCRTTYSDSGWQFLCDVDRGRCCSCRSRKTVYPLD